MNTSFDNLLGKAKSAADATGKKAGEVVELSKCKLQAVQIGNDIQEQYKKLGSAVYSMTKAEYDNPELVSAIVEEIDQLIEKLNETESKIASLKKNLKCPCCGENNPMSAKYCSHCGCNLEKQGTHCQNNDSTVQGEVEE